MTILVTEHFNGLHHVGFRTTHEVGFFFTPIVQMWNLRSCEVKN